MLIMTVKLPERKKNVWLLKALALLLVVGILSFCRAARPPTPWPPRTAAWSSVWTAWTALGGR